MTQTQPVDPNQLKTEVEQSSSAFAALRAEVARVVVGQTMMVERLLIGLIAGGHILLEGVPGLAKTTTVKAVADAVQTGFKRISFTPDLLPADVIGTQIYNPKSGEFAVKQGPIFTNILLADEINRAPAKVQSALLEAMQERQVTIGTNRFELPEPFLVLATQNPIEQEGTYPLPEAQVDRFMLKLEIGYPTRDEEKEILRRSMAGFPELTSVITPQHLTYAKYVAGRIRFDDKLIDYILDLVMATRDPASVGLADLTPLLQYGASPRATINLQKAARAHALLAGRSYVTSGDIKAIAPDVLRHRVVLSYEAEAEEVDANQIISRILSSVPVP
ncbi:MAG: MoxR family ATPase [Deltaproteobacteria bacterium]|nr:MoxR family ATPase [Deltaproteobacteria bacterium]